MLVSLPRPDWHWVVRVPALAVCLAWGLMTLGVPPFAEVRQAVDRSYPDSTIRAFLEAAPRGEGAGFVDPVMRNRPETAVALRTYLPEAFVGEFDRIGPRSADTIAVQVDRVVTESALEDRATVGARGVYRPQRRERQANFLFLDRAFQARYDVVRRDGRWYLVAVPPFVPKPGAE
jgi:hypothetical protein